MASLSDKISVNEGANEAWKKCILEVANLISDKATKTSIINNKERRNALSDFRTLKTPEVREFKDKFSKSKKELKKDYGNSNNINEVEISPQKSKITSSIKDCLRVPNFEELRRKFDANNFTSVEGETKILFGTMERDNKIGKESVSTNNLKLKCESGVDNLNTAEVHDQPVATEENNTNIYSLKKELKHVCDCNNNLKEELNNLKSENEDLRDQVQSLELCLKTITEAINLQDEQLSDYAKVMSTIKNSRALLVNKLKDANIRNAYNVMIMENVEQEIIQLRRHLDAYNELLISQNVELTDKASSTDENLVTGNAQNDAIIKKDNYIALLQNRLCEAIVDIQNKDSEIKNHANSVKTLIDNYESEKSCLEEKLNLANASTTKLEEHKIKQQETMKQLMKLVEFLQGKLEKMKI